MKFLAGFFGDGSPTRIGRQYMKVGRSALFGPRPNPDTPIPVEKIPKPLNLLVSQRGKFKHSEYRFFFIVSFILSRLGIRMVNL